MNENDSSIGTTVSVEWTGWPFGVTHAVLHVAEVLGNAPGNCHVTLTVPNPPCDASHRASLAEALRGLVQSSVLERPDIRVNLVFGGIDADQAMMVSYLETADFVFGATIDLGRKQ